MASSTLEFHLFPRLPLEIREVIWQLCLPHRVCELDYIQANVLYDGIDEPWPCELSETTTINSRPPIVTRICRGSRAVAFRKGGFLSNGDDRPLHAQWQNLANEKPWLDLSRDTLHVNWTQVCDADYNYDPIGHPLRNLVYEAGDRTRGVSIMVEYLELSDQARYGVPSANYDRDLFRDPDVGGPVPLGQYGRPLSTGQLINLEALQQLSTWHIVIRVLVIHCEDRKAASSGLFGLLGDARVQVVGMEEEQRLTEMLRFATQCEQGYGKTSNQHLVVETPKVMQKRLDDIVVQQFNLLTLTASMRPAIMFRLCTRMCNVPLPDV